MARIDRNFRCELIVAVFFSSSKTIFNPYYFLVKTSQSSTIELPAVTDNIDQQE